MSATKQIADDPNIEFTRQKLLRLANRLEGLCEQFPQTVDELREQRISACVDVEEALETVWLFLPSDIQEIVRRLLASQNKLWELNRFLQIKP